MAELRAAKDSRLVVEKASFLVGWWDVNQAAAMGLVLGDQRVVMLAAI